MATTLAAKLRLKAGHRYAVRAAREELEGNREEFGTLLRPVPAGCTRDDALSAPVDWLLVFVLLRKDLPGVAELAAQVKPDGLVQIAYPKARGLDTDLNRDRLISLMRGHGWQGLALISLDNVWSAMYFKRA